MADALLARYNDLAPSLNRIMGSGLGEAGRLHAITAFQDSLGVAGDPMRDPANAIAAGRLHDHPVDSPDATPAATYASSPTRCVRLRRRTAATPTVAERSE